MTWERDLRVIPEDPGGRGGVTGAELRGINSLIESGSH